MSEGLTLAEKRQHLSYSSDLGRQYLQLRKKSLRLGLTKSTAIPYVLRYIEEFPSGLSKNRIDNNIRIADFGCSEGSILREIQQVTPYNNIDLHGFDFNESLINNAKNLYYDINFHQSNIYLDNLEEFKNSFDIALSVNTVHEIFSFYGWNGHFNKNKGIEAAKKTINNIVNTIKPNGVFILFDGLETDLPLDTPIQIEMVNHSFENKFLQFITEYKPYKLEAKKISDLVYEMDIFSFTKFISKFIYMDSNVWSLEKEESYQYFNKNEFEDVFKEAGLKIESVNLLSPQIGTWQEFVKIKSLNISYPNLHILIVGRKLK